MNVFVVLLFCGLVDSQVTSALPARYCLPDSSLLLSYNPETASRVTLASLGIAFQAKLAYSVHSCSLSPITCFFLNTEIFLVDRLVAHSFYLWGEMMANRLKSVLFRFFYSVFLCRFIRKG